MIFEAPFLINNSLPKRANAKSANIINEFFIFLIPTKRKGDKKYKYNKTFINHGIEVKDDFIAAFLL
jgi:hypothetical protein